MGTQLLMVFLSKLPKLLYPILLISPYPGNPADSRFLFSPPIPEGRIFSQTLSRPKFNLPEWVVQELLDYVRRRAQWSEQHLELGPVVRDPADAKFLEAAVAGHADLIVSGDRDLLDLGRFESIAVISPREFLDSV